MRVLPGAHLLGAVQIIDKKFALIRREKVDPSVVKALMRHEYTIAGVDESEETDVRQGFNFVTIAPRTVIMASECPKLKKFFAEQGVDVAAEVPVSEIAKAGGGLACLTGILNREAVSYD